jgi:hypothetical protein
MLVDQELLELAGQSRRYKSGWSRAWNREGHIFLFIQQRRINYLLGETAREQLLSRLTITLLGRLQCSFTWEKSDLRALVV